MKDERPSTEDTERFSAIETGYCPHCGDEIWDDVAKCPSCGAWLEQGSSHRTLVSNEFRKKSIIIIVVVVLFAFLYGLLSIL